jgi:hypothetical protein
MRSKQDSGKIVASRGGRAVKLTLALLAFVVSAPLVAHADDNKYALLVGCSKYQLEGIPDLYGPANDVPLFAELLEKDFAFAKKNISCLVGWPADESARPTHDNIVKGFDDLIAKARPGVQIVILLSGHGVQVPLPKTQDPFDPANPEPDGMDEAFVPADARGWVDGGLEKILLDDQFGVWLDQLRGKGAAVWIIFDCCHSGNLWRSTEHVERPRQIGPGHLHIPEELVREAIQRASQAKQKDVLEPGTLAVKPSKKGEGSVVAFYAAQSFETAPELPRPRGSPAQKEFYHGLFSYTLAAILKQRQVSLTYRELAQVVAARYTAERKYRGPTPFFEGDLDREVLGIQKWPARSAILLARKETALTISAGNLHGLTPGSILAVHPHAGDKRPVTDVLGHVYVTHAAATSAVVVPCTYRDKPITRAEDLPELARCELISRDLGNLKIRVAVHAAGGKDGPSAATVNAALRKLNKNVVNLLEVTTDEFSAEWLLWIEGGRVFWRPGQGSTIAATNNPAANGYLWHERFGNHRVTDAGKLAELLENDIRTICTWQNVWRIAGELDQNTEDNEHGLKLKLVKLKEDDITDKPLLGGSPLRPGQRLALYLDNTGNEHLWVSLLFLDGNFGIKVHSFPVASGSSVGPIKGTVSEESTGLEGFVVLATAQSVSREQPNFDFLQQKGLAAGDTAWKEKILTAERSARTPFGVLLAAAAIGTGQRSYEEDAVTNPVILSCSWFTLPRK